MQINMENSAIQSLKKLEYDNDQLRASHHDKQNNDHNENPKIQQASQRSTRTQSATPNKTIANASNTCEKQRSPKLKMFDTRGTKAKYQPRN